MRPRGTVSATLTAVVTLGTAAGLAVVAAGTPGPSQGTPSAAASPYDVEATAKWRAEREVDLKKPEGWLSVAGLHFLEPGAHTIGTDPESQVALPPGSAPAKAGEVVVYNGKVRLELTPEVDATVNGEPLCKCGDGTVDLRETNPKEKRPADKVAIGRATVHVHRSGERLGLRVYDPESPVRRGFTSLSWFDVDPTWRLEGRFVPFDEPRPLEIENVLGDVEDANSPGEVVLELGAQEVRLLAISAANGRLWFIFSDATSGRGTYRFRYLYADAPKDGRVLLDFNRAYNPPCAFNPYTTCAMPPSQNRLTVPITAGERAYTGPAPEPFTTAKKIAP